MTLLSESNIERTAYTDRKPGLLPRFSRWLATVLAAHRARSELARIVRFHRSRASPPIPPYLRRDLGLPELEDEPWRGYDNW